MVVTEGEEGKGREGKRGGERGKGDIILFGVKKNITFVLVRRLAIERERERGRKREREMERENGRQLKGGGALGGENEPTFNLFNFIDATRSNILRRLLALCPYITYQVPLTRCFSFGAPGTGVAVASF